MLLKDPLVCCGWLLKTGSGNGPIDRHREALEASPHPATPPTVAAIIPGDPTFPKFFVLHERKRWLHIYTSDDAFRNGEPPRCVLPSVRSCAVMRLEPPNAPLLLALLPLAALKQPALAASAPLRAPSSSSTAAERSVADGSVSRGWYLRAADEAATNMWYGRLRAAGATWRGYDARAKRRTPKLPTLSRGSASKSATATAAAAITNPETTACFGSLSVSPPRRPQRRAVRSRSTGCPPPVCPEPFASKPLGSCRQQPRRVHVLGGKCHLCRSPGRPRGCGCGRQRGAVRIASDSGAAPCLPVDTVGWGQGNSGHCLRRRGQRCHIHNVFVFVVIIADGFDVLFNYG